MPTSLSSPPVEGVGRHDGQRRRRRQVERGCGGASPAVHARHGQVHEDDVGPPAMARLRGSARLAIDRLADREAQRLEPAQQQLAVGLPRCRPPVCAGALPRSRSGRPARPPAWRLRARRRLQLGQEQAQAEGRARPSSLLAPSARRPSARPACGRSSGPGRSRRAAAGRARRRANGSKIRSSSAGAMPGPCRRSRRSPSGAWRSTSLTSPRAVNFTALPSRLIRIWRSRFSSARTAVGQNSGPSISKRLPWRRPAGSNICVTSQQRAGRPRPAAA